MTRGRRNFTPEQDRELLDSRSKGTGFNVIAARFGHVNRHQCRNRYHHLMACGLPVRAEAEPIAINCVENATTSYEARLRKKAERGCATLHEATMAMLARRAAQVAA